MAGARWVRWIGTTALLVVFYFVVPVSSDPRGGLALRTVLAVVVFVALAALVAAQVRLVLVDPQHHIDGLLLAILLVWVLFSISFYVLAQHHPDQVAGLNTRLDGLYFTASTMLTIGFGDIHAEGQEARALVLVQMAFDVVFVTAAAQIVSGRLRTRAAERAENSANRTTSRRFTRPGKPK